MLDIKFIRENKEAVIKNNGLRKAEVDVGVLLQVDEERLELLRQVEELRAERKKRSKSKPSDDEIAEIRRMGEKIAELEKVLVEKEEAVNEMLYRMPNLTHQSVPGGKDESENKVEKTVGNVRNFNFAPQEHFEIEPVKNLIDMERGAKVAGSRFYYLKGKLAILERAVLQFAIDTMISKGFELVLPPLLVKESAMFATGFFPADKNEVYTVNPDEDNLYLIGTSEVPLVYFHSDETLDDNELPKKYVSVTPCFRREAGSYGKDTKGLIRVHQFYKAEMVVFCRPEESWKMHEDLLAHEEEVLQALGLPYEVVNVCTGDLGYPAAKKYDCNGWFPGQGRYRELTSTSNTTDYQARRSGIKFKNKQGNKELVHTLNGTVVSDRPLLAILENYQEEDGSVRIPEVLQKYTGFDKIT